MTLIMKFGGASLSNIKKIKKTALFIAERSKNFSNIIVVVSAMGNMTDLLLKYSKKITKNPNFREQDMLLTVGERISMSLLAIALLDIKIKAISFTGSQAGIITTDQHFKAKIIDVRPKRILEKLNDRRVIIVAGFQGVSEKKEITTLGRGGSDTTAVALAIALNASNVEFYKDVEGMYDKDPKIYKDAKKYDKLNYSYAIKLAKKGANILHIRALELAEKNNILLNIFSYKDFKKGQGTLIKDGRGFKKKEKYYEI